MDRGRLEEVEEEEKTRGARSLHSVEGCERLDRPGQPELAASTGALCREGPRRRLIEGIGRTR